MDHYLGLVLLTGLATAAVLFLYDTVITGPGWARVTGTVATALSWVVLLDPSVPRADYAVAVAAATVALLAVTLLEWLMVQRDAALSSVLRRR